MVNNFLKEEKIRFQHCDPAGIVFYPRFLEMLNSLVEDWFEEELGFPFNTLHKEGGMPIVNLKVDFRKVARLGETITKRLWINKISGVSVVFGFEFFRMESIILSGEGTLVSVRLSKDKKQIYSHPWNDDLESRMKKFIKMH